MAIGASTCQKTRVRVLSPVHVICTCAAEHMVCWISVQNAYRLCLVGLLDGQLSWYTVPVLCISGP